MLNPFPQLRGTALIAVIVFTCGVSFTLFGYDQGLMGGILGSSDFQDVLGHPGATMQGLVTGIYDIGCAFGAVVAFLISEPLGRKRSFIYSIFVVMIGAAIQTATYSLVQMAIARVIAGLGIGCMTVAVPIIQSESLPAHLRGSLMVVQGALIIVGIAVANWVCLGTHFAGGQFQWRFPVALQLLFCLVTLFFSGFLSETPRWLAKQGRVEEAREVLARIANKDPEHPVVQAQLDDILENIAVESEMGEPTWREVWSNDNKTRNLQRVLLGTGPYMMNQWSGINSVTYYMPVILTTYLNYTEIQSLVLAGAAFSQFAFFSTLPFLYFDRLGRRKTVMFSSAGCAICMAVIAGLLSTSYADAYVAAAVAFIFLYLAIFALGIMPTSWSYTAEIEPLRVRNKAQAVGVFWHWMANFVVVMVTPIGMQNLGGRYFAIWAAVCALFVPIVYFFYVETAGRTLEEIDRLFLEKPWIFIGLDKEATTVVRRNKAQSDAEFEAKFTHYEKEDVA